MERAPTAAIVLDGFLTARTASAASGTLDLDVQVLGWLRDCVQAQGLEPIDDLTAYLLSHSTGRLPTDRELAAVLALVEGIPEFFNSRLPVTVGASAEQMGHAAVVVRLLGRWLLVRRLVDEDVCQDLARFCDLYEGEDSPAVSIPNPGGAC